MSATVDGRRVTIDKRQDFTHGADEAPFWYDELRDAATGKVILERAPREIFAVPGRGVFVLPEDRQRTLREARKHHVAPGAEKNNGYEPRKPYERFDLATGKLTETDIIQIETHGRRESPAFVVVHQNPKDAMDFSADLVGPNGEPFGHFPSFGRRDGSPFELIDDGGAFSVLSAYVDGEKVDYLLGPNLEVVSAHAEGIQTFEEFSALPKAKHVVTFARRVPGTTEADDLWQVLQKNGEFAAPVGAIGVRPSLPLLIGDEPSLGKVAMGRTTRRFAAEHHLQNDARFTSEWWVRYQTSSDRELAWGAADVHLESFSKPRWFEIGMMAAPADDADSWYSLIVASDEAGWHAYPEGTDLVQSTKSEVGHAATLPDLVIEMNTVARTRKAQQEARTAAAEKAAREAERAEAARRLADAAAAWPTAVAKKDLVAMRRLVWAKGPEGWYAIGMSDGATVSDLERALRVVNEEDKRTVLKKRLADARERLRVAAETAKKEEAERTERARREATAPSASGGYTSSSWGSTSYQSSAPAPSFDAAAYGRQLDQQLRSVVNRPAWEPWYGRR